MTKFTEGPMAAVRMALDFQDTREPKYRAPETETAQTVLPKNWPTYADLRAFNEMYDALNMAASALRAIHEHPKNPWKGQHGDGIPVHVFCEAALSKARGETT